MGELNQAIAIIGLHGRFPGAANIESFWDNIVAGVESITSLDDQRLMETGVDRQTLNQSNYVKVKPMLEKVEWFDPEFFGYSPAEAAQIDPQQRLFLESAWGALEDAGYDPQRYDGWISVFASAYLPTYMMGNVRLDPQKLAGPEGLQLLIASDKDYIATRTAYKLNCKGAAVTVQTACSSSLVAVHLAGENLRSYQSDLAIAGGVALSFPHYAGYEYHPGSIMSPDGHCRPFSAQANGTVFGEAVGAVVLKRLEDAQRDRDFIYAVIRGSAVNNDGSSKAGYTAPAVSGQSRVIQMALAAADIPAETIGYLETHGTGTTLGDPLEVRALQEAFGSKSEKSFCALGSVKANIGHANTAAGIVGLIKTALILKNKYIPPQLYSEHINPRIDLDGSPFFIPNQGFKWDQNEFPRRAGVSSFGVGGTNAHIILEEAPTLAGFPGKEGLEIIVLSARSEHVLNQMRHNLAAHLVKHPDLPLRALAHTLQTGRGEFQFRQALVAKNLDELIGKLATDQRKIRSAGAGGQPQLVWLFPGQASQYPQMGKGLYDAYEPFRKAMDECARYLQEFTGIDIRKLIYTEAEQMDTHRERLSQTHFSQPAIFVVEYALTRLLLALGISPEAMIGYSLGEYVAACISGVFSLKDALWVVAQRAQLMNRVTEGRMLAVFLSKAELQSRLLESLDLAAVNGPSLCTVAGPESALKDFKQLLRREKIGFKELATSAAFHSRFMEPLMKEMEQIIAAVQRHDPRIPYISALTGTWITPQQAMDPHYYARQMRHPVQMFEGLKTIKNTVSNPSWLELGPGSGLAVMVKQAVGPSAEIIQTLPHETNSSEDGEVFLSAIGNLWSLGSSISWEQLFDVENSAKIPLPGYPFERMRCWLEPELKKEISGKPQEHTGLIWLPSWRKSPLVQGPTKKEQKGVCLLFEDELNLGGEIHSVLKESFELVIRVRKGKEYQQPHNDLFIMGAACEENLRSLWDQLKITGIHPDCIIFLWLYNDLHSDRIEDQERVMEDGLYTLMGLGKVMAAKGDNSPMTLTVIGNHLVSISGENEVFPEKYCITGLCASLEHEISGLRTKVIDLPESKEGKMVSRNLATWLVGEFQAEEHQKLVAYRQTGRWIRAMEPLALEEMSGSLQQGGVYLITGGLGGIGIELANNLGEAYQAKLVLVSRRTFPRRSQWDIYPSLENATLEQIQIIRTLIRLEELGASVGIITGDISNAADAERIFTEAKAIFGKIDGIFHCAGISGEGLLLYKSRDQVDKVLAPKIKGTKLLADLAEQCRAGFLMLFSSTLSLSGGAGQTDYAAANAFLNAFAAAWQNRSTLKVIAVDWDAWQGRGMAARTGLTLSKPLSRGDFYHPKGTQQSTLIDYEEKTGDGSRLFIKTFNLSKEWILAEHVQGKEGIIPGTAWINLIYQAAQRINPQVVWKISDLRLLAPCRVADGRPLTIRLECQPESGGYKISIFSLDPKDSVQYLIGQLLPASLETVDSMDLEAMKPLLRSVERDPLFEAVNRSGLLQWGPRWQNVRRLGTKDNFIAAFLSLDEKFLPDRESYPYHPALLDSALAIAALWDDSVTMFPAAYQTIQLDAHLPQQIYSVARIDRRSQKGSPIIADVTLFDENGNFLGKIEGFKLQRVTGGTKLKPMVKTGIPLETGLHLATCLSGLEQSAEIIVTPGSIEELLTGGVNPASKKNHKEESVSKQQLSTSEYTSQASVLQRLRQIWSEVLGISEVRPEDNFFDLGGHSLMAIQVLSRIRSAFAIELEAEAIFKAPTLNGLAERIEALLPLDHDEAVQDARSSMGISRIGGERKRFPLSSSQRRLFFYHELEGANTAYTLPSALEIDGELDAEALRQSLSYIVGRHEVLRTTFHQDADGLYQQIHEPYEFPIEAEDLTFYDENQAMTIARDKAGEVCSIPFDLGSLPLFRVTRFTINWQKHVLVILTHHIISDYWSSGVFFKELAQSYNAFTKGDEPRLAELPVQYGDYALWQQHDYFNSRDYQEDLKYWREHLTGAPELLQLPLDFPRPPEESHQGSTVQFVLERELINNIQTVCSQQEATLFMGLMTAFQVLLYRYSGQKDIIVGSPVSGRRFYETEKLLGMFVNNIVIRGKMEGSLSFIQLLSQLRGTIIDAFNHQDLPFEKLVEAAGVPRDLSYSPLFQVVFILQNVPAVMPELDGLNIRPDFIPQTTSKHDLTLECYPAGGGIICRLEYNSSIFRRDTVVRLLKNYGFLLEQIVKHPTESIDMFKIVHPEEVKLILTDFNPTEAICGSKLLIHEMVNETACRFPERVACEFAGQTMTYAELDGYSNRLAHFLKGLGVGPDLPVGVCMERSLKLPAIFQAILKSGGAYIPLDPLLPAARIKSILEDAKVQWVLMDSVTASIFWGLTARMIRIDSEEVTKGLRSQPQTPVNAEVQSSNLAYIIYTSGSTGKPKGVAVEHHNLANLIHSMRHKPGITAEDVLLALTTISFDMSIPEFHLPLAVGAKIIMASRETAVDAGLLAEIIQKGGVTMMQGTPATWRLLLFAGWQGSSKLKILCGGEALTKDLARELIPRCDSLWNLYGPTETTVWSSLTRIDNPEEITIGHPIDHTYLVVLDEHLQMAPVGVPGTLFIGGEGVSRGYLNQEGKTWEKFIPVTLADSFSHRFYNTGDLARFLPDGRLEYLGRNDFQVKIRGYRIELGEIEARIGALNGVSQCAVIAVKDKMGIDQLIAYYTEANGARVEMGEIRDSLHHFLPDYMIPAFFYRLERFPLTANGKVDRKALANIRFQTGNDHQNREQPSNDLEKLIAKIWGEFTGHPVSRQDHFFESGGHSLLAMQVLSRLRRELSLDIPLKLLYTKPVLHELAAALQILPKETEHVQMETAAGSVATAVDYELPLTMMQRWFFQELPQRKQAARWNTGLLLKITYPLDDTFLSGAALAVFNHHQALRALFLPKGNGEWLQRIMPLARQSPAEFIDLSNRSVLEQKSMIGETCDLRQNNFNLEAGPLFQVILFKLGDEDFRLWINAHHLLLDGVSLMIILEDIMTAYDQLEQGQRVALLSAGTGIAKWTEELVKTVRDIVMNEREYWLTLPWQEIPWLPADYPETRHLVTVASIRSLESTLDHNQTYTLTNTVPKKTGIELNNILIAALLQAVTAWTGRPYQDIMVLDNGRNLLADRDDLDLTRTVGWVSSERVLVLKRSLATDSYEAVRELHAQIRSIPGNGHGYNLLRYLGGDEELSTRLGTLRKRPGILFNFLGNVDLFENHPWGMSFAEETTGFDEPGDNLRFNLLELHVFQIHNHLQLGWRYSSNVHSLETIQKLDASVKEFLNNLVKNYNL